MMLSRLKTLSKELSTIGGYISSSLLILLVILTMIEIIGRSFFDYSTMISDEYSGYLYLATVFFGLSYAFEQGSHIRINLLTSRFSEKTQEWIDVYAGLISLSVMLFVLYYCWVFMMDSYKMEMLSENFSETPLYLTQIPMPIGIALFAFSFIVFSLKRIFNDR